MAIWSWCLSDKPSLQDLLEVQKHFGLPSPALVEKDWYVVKALAALVAVDAAPFRLVFGGGRVALAGGSGPTALVRLNSDVLGREGVTHVIFFEGTNDIGGGPCRNPLRFGGRAAKKGGERQCYQGCVRPPHD